jgi:hypothetical protein
MSTHDPENVANSPGSNSTPVPPEKDVVGSHVEAVHTNERVPGHTGYYEKDGLRTYGDDMDHDHEPPVCFSAARSIMFGIITNVGGVCSGPSAGSCP